MMEKRWLTKTQKRLLAAHAEHYQAMYEYITDASTDELEAILNACRACTTSNCWWAEYEAGKFLTKEIPAELLRRRRNDEAEIEKAQPIALREAQWADDGGRVYQ